MKLTKQRLHQMIREEAANIGGTGESPEDRAKDTKEVDADEYAGTLEKDIDFMKALKIEESRVVKRLKAIREKKNEVASRIIGKI
jgi:hypothetical protein